MGWYYYIAWAAILSQLLFLLLCYKNYRYALTMYKRQRPWQKPRVALIIPCKGIDPEFHRNIASAFNLDYENYILWFVIHDKSDPAYQQLCTLKDQLAEHSKAHEINIFIAGSPKSCSQKIHNLLYCCKKIPENIDILAFADSDACLRPEWLRHIVWPLRKSKTGLATGYRWFIPKQNNSATLVLAAVNAKIAQLLGNSRFNQAWGGSMAIRTETFRSLGIEKLWQKTLSDDLSLSYAVKKAHKKIAFIPACLVASYESTTWPKFFEFGRRQFLITRVSAPKTWWFGLFSSLYSICGLYAGTAMAIYAAISSAENLPLFIAVPFVFLVGQFTRAILRQRMAAKLLAQDAPKMKAAAAADVLTCWLTSPLLLFLILSSAFGRTITWRGIRYKLLGPTETIVLDQRQA